MTSAILAASSSVPLPSRLLLAAAPPGGTGGGSTASRHPPWPATRTGALGAGASTSVELSPTSGLPCQCPRRKTLAVGQLPTCMPPSSTTRNKPGGSGILAPGAYSLSSIACTAASTLADDHDSKRPDLFTMPSKKFCCKRIGFRSLPKTLRKRRVFTRKSSHLLTTSTVMLKGSLYRRARSQMQEPVPSNGFSALCPASLPPPTMRNSPDFTK
mmetsp:Transcript_59551/g.130698  ORF Transcript_59551/g.130698 Transcript_59551/m.130698 type:complete len:214 (-) Transcript_59551:262-903(-)